VNALNTGGLIPMLILSAHSINRIGLLLAATAMLGPPLSAQPSVTIPDAVSCARCTISTRSIVRIGSADGPGALSGMSSVMLDSRGRYWVFESETPPKVFSSDGRFLETIGSRGEGPGEFMGAGWPIQIPGDSLVLLDQQLRRATIIGPDLRIGRMIRLPGSVYTSVVVHWPDTVISNGRIMSRNALHIPLHTVSFAGSVAEFMRSFGHEGPPPSGYVNPFAAQRRISASRSGGVWISPIGRYELSLWTASGTKMRTIQRTPSWFVPSDDVFLGTPTSPPPATIQGIREDPATGLIWVLISVAARTWREGWPAQPGGREVSVRSIAFEKLTDTRIEVLDPSTGRLVAVGSIPGPASLLRDGRAAVYTVDADDIPRMNIIELRLGGWTSNPTVPR
jgi:hypothetical protein